MLASELDQATRQLLETGTTTVLKDGVLELDGYQINLTGFKDATLTEVELFGDDWHTLAPDSALNQELYRQTRALIVSEAGNPIIAFVRTNRLHNPDLQSLIAVNVNRFRDNVQIKSRDDSYSLGNGYEDGGLHLGMYALTHGGRINDFTINLAKKSGKYLLSVL